MVRRNKTLNVFHHITLEYHDLGTLLYKNCDFEENKELKNIKEEKERCLKTL
jgi:hypothetical protein